MRDNIQDEDVIKELVSYNVIIFIETIEVRSRLDRWLHEETRSKEECDESLREESQGLTEWYEVD
jgi:hypothetical protein